MTDTQLNILEMKNTMKRMMNYIAELTRLIAERESNIAARNYRCMNLVPSTQACDVVYDKE